MPINSTFNDLKRYVEQKARDLGWNKKDEAFAFWFCQAALTDEDDTETIKKAITNGKHEKECDIIFINDQNKTINICQAKYRSKLGAGTEKPKDIYALLDTVQALIGDESDWLHFIEKASRKVKEILPTARERFLNNKYDICLYFLTPYKISQDTKDESDRQLSNIIRNNSLLSDRIRYIYLDSYFITDIFEDFQLRSPFIPQISLEFIGDVCCPKKDVPVECFVFSTTARAINRLYKDYKDRLFAKNIRLGISPKQMIPNAIRNTLKKEPENFFYMNNGITFLASFLELRGNKIFITNPQIINGQQTTRNIGLIENERSIKPEATVLIKAISPKQNHNRSKEGVLSLINGIIKASNSQNPVKITQLVSNNKEQILLEKNLAQENWLYERKLGKYDKPPTRHFELTGKKTGSFNISKITDSVLSNEHDPQIVPSNGAAKIFDFSDLQRKRIYDAIFKSSKTTHEFIFHHLISEAAKPSKKFRKKKVSSVLHRRGRWYVSYSMYQILKGLFSRNSKLILHHLGHSASGPLAKNSNIKQLSDVFHSILKDFFDRKGQFKYPQNPAAFIQSELAKKKNWEVFSTSHYLFKEAKKLSKKIGQINIAA